MNSKLLFPFFWFWPSFVFLFLLDQATKMWAKQALEFEPSLVLIPSLIRFTYVENTGIAFGWAQGQNAFLAIVALGLIGLGVWWARQLNWNSYEVNIVGAFLLAGALGNLVDRFWHGYVIDFIDITIPWINYPWPVFNLADSFICMSVIWIIFRQFFPVEHHFKR